MEAKKLPLIFSIDNEQIRPVMITASHLGLGIGEGFDIELGGLKTTDSSVDIDVYYMAWNTEVSFEVIEKNPNTQSEQLLGKRVFADERTGFFRSNMRINDTNSRSTYIIRATFDKATPKRSLFVFGISGAVLKP